jgi:hypothetical protein
MLVVVVVAPEAQANLQLILHIMDKAAEEEFPGLPETDDIMLVVVAVAVMLVKPTVAWAELAAAAEAADMLLLELQEQVAAADADRILETLVAAPAETASLLLNIRREKDNENFCRNKTSNG